MLISFKNCLWISDGDDDIYMTLDILWNAVFFLQRKKNLSFMLIQSTVKTGWAKNNEKVELLHSLKSLRESQDVERIILWCHFWRSLAFAEFSAKVCFHCFGKVFLWCFQRLQKDVKDLPWSISKISPPAFTVFFQAQTASPSRFFRASRKLFNRPPKVQNAVSYSITLLAQRVFCLSPNVFQKWGKWGGGKSPRLCPISAKITCTALLNSPKVQFFYSMCHCRHIIMARSLLLCWRSQEAAVILKMDLLIRFEISSLISNALPFRLIYASGSVWIKRSTWGIFRKDL